ncbi:hypothetical protein [Nocardia donostiensis]|nr:hypothetical protein [Nocardia donostiensis]
MTRKDARLQLMFARVLDKIEREHLRLDGPAVRDRLQVIRREVTGPSMHRAVNQWEQWIATGDLTAIRQLRDSDGDTVLQLRSLSPLNVLLSERERIEVLDELHQKTHQLMSA